MQSLSAYPFQSFVRSSQKNFHFYPSRKANGRKYLRKFVIISIIDYNNGEHNNP